MWLNDPLKLHASRELHLTWVGRIAWPRSASNVSGTLDVSTRKGEVDMVEPVERIGAELQSDPLLNREVLQSR